MTTKRSAIFLKMFLTLMACGLVAAYSQAGDVSPESLQADGWVKLTNADKKGQISGNTLVGVDGSWAAYFHPVAPDSDEIRVSSLTSDWTDQGRTRPGQGKSKVS